MGDQSGSEIYAHEAAILHRSLDTDQLLTIAKKHARDPEALARRNPYFVPVQISSSRYDSYFTYMMESTLKNFAEAAERGVSVQDSHDTTELGFGRSVTGVIETDPTDNARAVYSVFYTVPGIHLSRRTTDDYIAGIETGLVQDISVGFHLGEDGRFVCNICGGDPTDWFGDCRHIPGVKYPVIDPATGEPVNGETQLCLAGVSNGQLSEYSTVYDGATPGAMIQKAQIEAENGRISRSLAERLMETRQFQRHKVKLPTTGLLWTGARAAPGGARMEGENTNSEENQQNLEPAVGEVGEETIITDATPETNDESVGTQTNDEQANTETPADVLAESRSRWAPHNITIGRDVTKAVNALAGKVVEQRTEIARLRGLADLGERYRDDLIERALKSHVAAVGAERAKTEFWRGVMAKADIEEIKEMDTAWQDDAAARLRGQTSIVGGRVTRDANETAPGGGTRKRTDDERYTVA